MSISGKTLATLSVGAVAVTVLIFFVVILEVQDLHEDTCKGLTAIASDSQKMEYVRAWSASRTNDKAFTEVIRRGRTFEPGDPRLHKQIDLDWGYLGFTPEFASLTFNFKDSDKHDLDDTRIGSVSLTQSRVSIIIKLPDAVDLALSWPPEELRKLRPVGDNVFVYCQNDQ